MSPSALLWEFGDSASFFQSPHLCPYPHRSRNQGSSGPSQPAGTRSHRRFHPAPLGGAALTRIGTEGTNAQPGPQKRGKGSRASCHAHTPKRLKPPGCCYFWAPDPLQAPGSPWDSEHIPSTTPTPGHALPLDSSLGLVGPGKQSQSQLWCLALLWHGLY